MALKRSYCPYSLLDEGGAAELAVAVSWNGRRCKVLRHEGVVRIRVQCLGGGCVVEPMTQLSMDEVALAELANEETRAE